MIVRPRMSVFVWMVDCIFSRDHWPIGRIRVSKSDSKSAVLAVILAISTSWGLQVERTTGDKIGRVLRWREGK